MSSITYGESLTSSCPRRNALPVAPSGDCRKTDGGGKIGIGVQRVKVAATYTERRRCRQREGQLRRIRKASLLKLSSVALSSNRIDDDIEPSPFGSSTNLISDRSFAVICPRVSAACGRDDPSAQCLAELILAADHRRIDLHEAAITVTGGRLISLRCIAPSLTISSITPRPSHRSPSIVCSRRIGIDGIIVLLIGPLSDENIMAGAGCLREPI
jgi:hypothetical protein